jgi:tripartite-type tricarboxylate transporter receptor subunit TctC
VRSWIALIMPRDTPPEVVARINKDFSNVLASPPVQDRLRIFGFTSEAGTPEDLTRTMRDDMARNSELIKRTGASAQ